MRDDLIRRSDVYKAVYDWLEGRVSNLNIKDIPSVDIPQGDDWEKYSDRLWKIAYERGKKDEKRWWSGHCAKYTDEDRPQGYWAKTDVATYRCSECGKKQIADDVNELNYCCCCGSRNKVRIIRRKEN